MSDANYLSEVREQYEELPYPRREPEEEKTRILEPTLNVLAIINHYCFKGKQDFNGFRVLAAGDGTGDSTIFLAEQLKEKNAEIVYVDISKASMKVAQERARIRGLSNIKWIHGSILSLTEMDIGEFDYITCTGVLHHLENPEDGLISLRSVLRPGGAIGILIYGKIGRTGLYQMQDLMRIVNIDEQDIHNKVENTRAILKELPATNWWVRGKNIMGGPELHGAASVYDMFLHSQDRAYTVPEMYEFVSNCGLNFVEHSEKKLFYRPETYIKDRILLKKIYRLDREKREAIAELIAGDLIKHVFYVSNQTDTIAVLDDPDNVPFLLYTPIDTQKLHDTILGNPGQQIVLKRPDGFAIGIRPRKYTHLIFKYLDGNRCFGDIFEHIRHDLEQPDLNDQEIFEDFLPIFTAFNNGDWLLLRDKCVDRYKTRDEIQGPLLRKYSA